jgi:Domain of unknown function (DUF4330)/IPT/TIG domain
MTFIDDRGRLFGKVNLIDAGVVLVISVICAFGVQLRRIANYPTPIIERVEPAKIPIGKATMITVYGKNFDPQTVVKAGASPTTGVFQTARFISPTQLEFMVSEGLAEGYYFVLVANRANKMATLTNAFVVEVPPPALPSPVIAPPPQVPAGPPPVFLRLRTKAYGISAAVAESLQPGDIDLGEKSGELYPRAELERIIEIVPAEFPHRSRTDKDATLDIIVHANHEGPHLPPSYRDAGVRLGHWFSFDTYSYNLTLLVESVDHAERGPMLETGE